MFKIFQMDYSIYGKIGDELINKLFICFSINSNSAILSFMAILDIYFSSSRVKIREPKNPLLKCIKRKITESVLV